MLNQIKNPRDSSFAALSGDKNETYPPNATRLLLLSLMLICTSFLLGQHESEKNLETSFSVGVGVPYNFNLETVGINARVYYNIGEHICFGPEVAYVKSGLDEVFDADFIGHYIWEVWHWGIYAMGGLNLTREIHNEEAENVFGGIYGLGIHKNIASYSVFLEYSRIVNRFDDQFITLGLLYNF